MRLFTGIALAPGVQGNLARVLNELRPLASLNWSPVENLHITSKFIGAWPEERLPELQRALEGMSPRGCFEVTIARFGYFPNPHHPRTLFAGVQSASIEGKPALAEVAKQLDDTLAPLGVAREDRAYSPHLTLARIQHENIRALREHIAKMTNFDFGTFQVSEFHLYVSTAGAGGTVYTPLSSYSLTPAAASSQK
jgi:2'-5' RNA ligase